MGNIFELEEIIMTDLDTMDFDRILNFAAEHGITKRQIGIACYGKSWRSIYKQKAQDPRIIKRNKRIADAVYKILEDKNA